MEGCEECGDEYHIVGVFSTKKLAEEAKERHKKSKHLHWHTVNIDEIILNEYIKSSTEKYCFPNE